MSNTDNSVDMVEQSRLEVEANYAYFEKLRPELKLALAGKHALLHRQQIIAFYDDEREAVDAGIKKYGMGNFSYQPVDDDFLDLGYWQHIFYPPQSSEPSA